MNEDYYKISKKALEEMMKDYSKSYVWSEGEVADHVNDVFGWNSTKEEKKVAKKGRPKKRDMGPTEAHIEVKQNGYMVTVEDKEYVFNELEDMNKWMADRLSPKLDSVDFVDAL